MAKSRNTIARLPPVHPGEILKETLDDLGLSMNQLAQEIHVPANRISAIVGGKRSNPLAMRGKRRWKPRFDREPPHDASSINPRGA